MCIFTLHNCPKLIPYTRELNLAVGSQIAIANVLADLNLAVRYGIAICIYASNKFWRILIWRLLMQTAKLSNLIPHQIFQLYGSDPKNERGGLVIMAWYDLIIQYLKVQIYHTAGNFGKH